VFKMANLLPPFWTFVSFLTSLLYFYFLLAGTVFGNGKTSDYLLLGNFVYTVSSAPFACFCLKPHLSSLPHFLSDLNVCVRGGRGMK
jgi:hypothetical protein